MLSWQLAHLVDNSWHPLLMSSMSFSLMLNTLLWFKFGFKLMLALSVFSGAMLVFAVWFRDITRESAYQGQHSNLVQSGLKWGLIWFLFSEVWFFFSVFWTFFHMSVTPLTSLSWEWPMWGLTIIPPFQVPLLNTVILLMSGVTATLAHHQLLANKGGIWIGASILLGAYFLSLQMMEYSSATYTISSGGYGSVFFFGTGFHGLHVCLGTAMLLVSGMRLLANQVTAYHHFGVEFSLWYWHFVDVVWLFLFFWVYTWGS